MGFLDTIDEEAAEGRVAEQYQSERSSKGYLPNYIQAFSLRPEVYDAWAVLIDTIRANMDLRRYELVTLAAARALRSSYCALAHGKILLDRFVGEEDLRDLVVGEPQDGVDRAVKERLASGPQGTFAHIPSPSSWQSASSIGGDLVAGAMILPQQMIQGIVGWFSQEGQG